MKFNPRKARIYRQLLAISVMGTSCTSSTHAILMPSLSNYAAHKELSSAPPYRFTTYIEVMTVSGAIVTSSGVAIAPNIVLVAAHGIPSVTSSAVVSAVLMGPNVLSSEAKSYSVRKWERYPGYIPGNTNTLDFGLIYLDEFITGLSPASFGSASIGQTLTFVGYGSFAGMFDSVSQPTLGDRLAGHILVDSGVGSSYPSSLHLHTFLSISTPVSSLYVKGLPGDSGGPYFNQDGHIVGIHTAQTSGLDGGIGSAMRTDNPDFLNYVSPRITASWSEFYAQLQPELKDVSIQAPTGNQPPKISGTVANGPPLGTARLQASLDLGATDPWADLASVTLDSEGSATFTNISDSRTQALGAHSDYFRVVTESPSLP